MNWDIFLKKHWQLILFNFLILLIFTVFYGHFGNIMVDSFREAYIPKQMINGQVLYKDIFCVYPPLAYLINSVLMLIFGAKLSVLYFVGLILTFGITNLLFAITNKFLPKAYSLSIILFTISVSLLSNNVFNFIFPYSYGIMYGILFVLSSVYFCLIGKFRLSYLMYMLAICSKYEFIFLLPVLFWYSGKKEFIKSLPIIIVTPIIVFAPLFIMGLKFDDLANIFELVITMSSTKTLYWFYSISGLTFRPELVPIYGLNFLKFFIPLIFMYYFRHPLLVVLTAIYFWFAVSPAILIYIFPLVILLFIFNYKNLNYNKKFVILSSLLVSIKLFSALTFQSYGVYFVPFALLSLFIASPRRYKKSLMIIIFILSLIFGIKNIQLLSEKNIKISSQRGVIYSTDFYGYAVNELINFVQNETNPDDKILVFPEGTITNFMSGRNTDNKLYSLIPLYVETFGEENIIKKLESSKPEYIAICNYDTSDYYYSYFGQDYAKEIYNFILSEYKPIKQIGKGFIFIIFKLKQ